MSDLYLGDCLEVRSVVAENSVDTIITDPPYGLEFMGKGWDKGVPGVEFWKEFLAVTKPGGTLLAFGGTRTFHRMTVAIEDAGWEIRDCMMWLYGSGFPKSLDISKAIDKAKGAEREVVGINQDFLRRNPKSNHKNDFADGNGNPSFRDGEDAARITAPATDLAREWSGWGTALKPAWEPIIVAMKPTDGTYADNAEKWGVAGLNVDGGRVGTTKRTPGYHNPGSAMENTSEWNSRYNNGGVPRREVDTTQGRWPANLLLDEEAAAMLDEQSGERKVGDVKPYRRSNTGSYSGSMPEESTFRRAGDTGGASRFFYCAKASKSERGDGNVHPTVKPLKLMEYLCTLTKTPTGGVVLDPFSGSGTTLLAAKNTGREYIGIEQNPEYFQIIKTRLGI